MNREPGWRVWLEASRPRTLPAAVAPVLAGSALAAHDGRFEGRAAGLCLGFALLVQIGTNFANDYFDFVKGADTAARIGPKRAVASGRVAPRTMKAAAACVFAAAFVAGLGLVKEGGPWLVAVGVSSIVCGIAYTGGPFPLAYHGLGDVFVFVFFGLVAVGGTYFVQAGRLCWDVWPVAAALGLLITNILVINNYRDIDSDRVAGKRTLAVRWGRGFARFQVGASLSVALALPVVLWRCGFSPTCLLPVALAPVAWRHFGRLRAGASAQELIDLLGQAGRLVAAYAALLAAGLLL
jgi:1,4-dihydroxy-2-naphthoate polyprenyltransferase